MENQKVTFSFKDAKIIKDNPGKSPYELQALGLSLKGFEKLFAQQSTGTEPIADPSIVDEDEEKKDPLEYQTPPDNEPAAYIEDEEDDEQETPATPEHITQPPKNAPLIPKVTQIPKNQVNSHSIKLLPNQVLVQTPLGKLNPMGREFAEKLVKMDPKYKIVQ